MVGSPRSVCVLAVVWAVAGVTTGCAAESRDLSGCREVTAAREYSKAVEVSRPLLDRLDKGLRAPGMTLAVSVRGRLVWSVACGHADRARDRPTSEGTRFRIGSVSKAITAAALMRYAAAGDVDLDAPVSRYLPEFPHGREISLRRLAGHLGGIRHYQTPGEVVNTRHFSTVRDSLRIFEDDPLVAPPETRFAYSSYGYDVIGAALEAATGETFRALVGRAVLAPARLARTTLGGAPAGAGSSFEEASTAGPRGYGSPRRSIPPTVFRPAASSRRRSTWPASGRRFWTGRSSRVPRRGRCSRLRRPETAPKPGTGSASRSTRVPSGSSPGRQARSAEAPPSS